MDSTLSVLRSSRSSAKSMLQTHSSVEDDLFSNNTKLRQELKGSALSDNIFKITIKPIRHVRINVDNKQALSVATPNNSTQSNKVELRMTSLSTVDAYCTSSPTKLQKTLSLFEHQTSNSYNKIAEHNQPPNLNSKQDKLYKLASVFHKISSHYLAASYNDMKSHSQFQSLLSRQAKVRHSSMKTKNIASSNKKNYRQQIKAHYSLLFAQSFDNPEYRSHDR